MCLNEVIFPFTYRSEVFSGKPEDVEGAEPILSYYALLLVYCQAPGAVRLEEVHGYNWTTGNL